MYGGNKVIKNIFFTVYKCLITWLGSSRRNGRRSQLYPYGRKGAKESGPGL